MVGAAFAGDFLGGMLEETNAGEKRRRKGEQRRRKGAYCREGYMGKQVKGHFYFIIGRGVGVGGGDFPQPAEEA